MKAIVITEYGSTDVLQLKEVAKPVPGDNEILIKVHAASVNDWDWGMMRGKPFLNRMLFGLVRPKLNIPGVDIAGQIESIGKNVRNFQVGDDVFGDISESGFGGFAEYVCVNENGVVRKPAEMPYAEAAAMPHASMLAIQGLRDIGQIGPGQKILINGAGGGVGTFGVQIAGQFGVEVTGVDSTGKLQMMLDRGFDHVIDYKQEDFTKNGKTYDLILDAKSIHPVFDYVRALSPNGTYVTVGGSMPLVFLILLLSPWISLFCKKKMRIVILKSNKDLDYIKELYKTGKIKPVIDRSYTLSEVPEAMEHFGKGNHKGKIIINIEHNDQAEQR